MPIERAQHLRRMVEAVVECRSSAKVARGRAPRIAAAARSPTGAARHWVGRASQRDGLLRVLRSSMMGDVGSLGGAGDA